MNNPLFNMMNQQSGNFGTQQMLMTMLQQNNPRGYQQLKQLMSSGQDPKKVLEQMTSQMSPQQLSQVQAMARQFGIR